MGGDLVLVAVLSVLIIGTAACIPLIRARMELRRLKDRYLLSDEEIEAYVRELPEICHAVESSLGPGTSGREVRRIASESAISAILRERRFHPPEMRGIPAIEREPAKDGAAVPAAAATVTRDDLINRSS